MGTVALIILSSLAILGGGVALSIYIGRRASSEESWSVGGRSLPVYVVAGSQFASCVGGGVLVAHIGNAYLYGWSTFTYGIVLAGGLFLLSIIAKWLRKQHFTTIPDVIEKLYGRNRFLLVVAALMAIVVPFGWSCTQLVAFGKLFATMTGISFNILVIVFALFSLAFVLPAGLSSVAWTDFIYGVFMLLMSFGSAVYITQMAGGVEQVFQNAPTEISAFPHSMGAVGSFTVLLWIFSVIPGGLTNQLYYQRIFAVKHVSQAKTSLAMGALAVLISLVWASYMGIAIRGLEPGLESEMAASWFMARLPVGFMAIYSGFLVATMMSTTDSAIQSVVVNVKADIYEKFINPDETDDRKLLKISRLTATAVTVLSVIMAIFFPHALDWLVASYAYSASALLAPIFAGYFLKDNNILTQQGAVISMISGFIGCASAQIIGTEIPYVAYGLVSSLAGLLIGSYLTKSAVQLEVTNNI